MSGALSEPEGLEVPQVDAALGELLVELDHGRLVLGANWPDSQGVAT